MTERRITVDASRVSAVSFEIWCSWRPRYMRYVVPAVRTPASSSDSNTVGTSAGRCSAFMLKTVSLSWRAIPNRRDALKLDPYSTYRPSSRWYQFIDRIPWRSCRRPGSIDAAQTGVTDGDAAQDSSTEVPR